MVKKNVPKSVKMSQFSIGKSTLNNDILRSKEKFKKFKAEKEELGLAGAAKTVKRLEATLTSWTVPFTYGFDRNVRRAVQ